MSKKQPEPTNQSQSVPTKHSWKFATRFRAHAFDWHSQPAIPRIKEAVSEIKKVARADPSFGAEGAARFLERLSPVLEWVDNSSGAIGAAVGKAIRDLVPIVMEASASDRTRDLWLDRLWTVFHDDEIPYLEIRDDCWGSLYVTRERASRWADTLRPPLEDSSGEGRRRGSFFRGTTAGLSCLWHAHRYAELLAVLEMAPFTFWPFHRYDALALEVLGRVDDALAYAERSVGINDQPSAMAELCEGTLLEAGPVEETYSRYGRLANQRNTGLTTFRAVARKYPSRDQAAILVDLSVRPRGIGVLVRCGEDDRALY